MLTLPAGLTALAQALDSKQAHTSFGKLPLSVEKTAPNYNFPKARRDEVEKLYMGELSKKGNAGKTSPGPAYMFKDEVRFENQPAWTMGTGERGGADKPKYDFYENALFLDDPVEADMSRKPRCRAPKIGTEPRFNAGAADNLPGPQYMPKEKPSYKRAAEHTFGYRRGNILKNNSTTPNSVGPGRYFPEACVNPSDRKNLPRWTLPKAGRNYVEKPKADRNQTYDTRSAFGSQAVSKNKSAATSHFGSSNRA